jgi:hypothetical protein
MSGGPAGQTDTRSGDTGELQHAIGRGRALYLLITTLWLRFDKVARDADTDPRISMVDHLFGGPWTEIKLDAVGYYLECYIKALKRVGFDLWYIDAFAGSGDRTTERTIGGILEGVPISIITETLAVSARRALAVSLWTGMLTGTTRGPRVTK